MIILLFGSKDLQFWDRGIKCGRHLNQLQPYFYWAAIFSLSLHAFYRPCMSLEEETKLLVQVIGISLFSALFFILLKRNEFELLQNSALREVPVYITSEAPSHPKIEVPLEPEIPEPTIKQQPFDKIF